MTGAKCYPLVVIGISMIISEVGGFTILRCVQCGEEDRVSPWSSPLVAFAGSGGTVSPWFEFTVPKQRIPICASSWKSEESCLRVLSLLAPFHLRRVCVVAIFLFPKVLKHVNWQCGILSEGVVGANSESKGIPQMQHCLLTKHSRRHGPRCLPGVITHSSCCSSRCLQYLRFSWCRCKNYISDFFFSVQQLFHFF